MCIFGFSIVTDFEARKHLLRTVYGELVISLQGHDSLVRKGFAEQEGKVRIRAACRTCLDIQGPNVVDICLLAYGDPVERWFAALPR